MLRPSTGLGEDLTSRRLGDFTLLFVRRSTIGVTGLWEKIVRMEKHTVVWQLSRSISGNAPIYIE